MQLRVVSYNEITDLRNGYILVHGERDPGFFRFVLGFSTHLFLIQKYRNSFLVLQLGNSNKDN